MAIFSALHGFVSLEVSGYFGGVDDLDAVFEQVDPRRRHRRGARGDAADPASA